MPDITGSVLRLTLFPVNTVLTKQEDEQDQDVFCKRSASHYDKYEEYRLLGCCIKIMEVESFSEKSANIYQTVCCKIPEGNHLQEVFCLILLLLSNSSKKFNLNPQMEHSDT
jgi:hypothetical protein